MWSDNCKPHDMKHYSNNWLSLSSVDKLHSWMAGPLDCTEGQYSELLQVSRWEGVRLQRVHLSQQGCQHGKADLICRASCHVYLYDYHGFILTAVPWLHSCVKSWYVPQCENILAVMLPAHHAVFIRLLLSAGSCRACFGGFSWTAWLFQGGQSRRYGWVESTRVLHYLLWTDIS